MKKIKIKNLIKKKVEKNLDLVSFGFVEVAFIVYLS